MWLLNFWLVEGTKEWWHARDSEALVASRGAPRVEEVLSETQGDRPLEAETMQAVLMQLGHRGTEVREMGERQRGIAVRRVTE